MPIMFLPHYRLMQKLLDRVDFFISRKQIKHHIRFGLPKMLSTTRIPYQRGVTDYNTPLFMHHTSFFFSARRLFNKEYGG